MFLASGGEVLYGVTVRRDGDAWSLALISMREVAGDRQWSQPPPVQSEISVSVPAADVPHLPEAFDWWAWSDTNRQAPSGGYVGDDCPNGASETAVETPGLARFPG